MSVPLTSAVHTQPALCLDVTQAAPAKVNIFLAILGRRDDGFHDLETIFQTISLADTVRVQCLPHAADNTPHSPHSPPAHTHVTYTDDRTRSFGSDDLAYRAVEAFRRHCPRLQRVQVTITKRIPISAGLGGGSSDAAAVLRILHAASPIDEQLLRTLALELGSDVPFFLLGGTVYATGRGEICEPLADLAYDPALHGRMYLLTPQTGNNTAGIFAQLATPKGAPAAVPVAQGMQHWRRLCATTAGTGWYGAMKNCLTRPACVENTELQQLCTALKAAACQWLMSGSGSSCFVFAASAADISTWLPEWCASSVRVQEIQLRRRTDVGVVDEAPALHGR